MDKNDSFTPQEKRDNNKQTVVIPLMIMAVLLIADLYVMIHMPGNYLVFALVTILFLVSAYFLGTGILKELQANKMRAEEQYEAITKSGKASYILLKKAFEQLEEIEGNSKMPAEDIITAQKAIAKVTISRNKENTDALLNSNDKVLEKIFDFEENFGNNQNDLLDRQRGMIDNSMKALMQQQQEMALSMKAMEESIKNELLQAMSSMQAVQPAANLNLGESESAMDFDLGDSELIPDLGIDLLSEEEPQTEEPIVEEPVVEEAVKEPEFVKEEDTAMPELSDPHKMMTPEEIAALIAKM